MVLGRPELGRIGLWSTCFDPMAPAEAAETVAEIEEQGWGTLWFGEAYGREAFTQASMLLAASSRMAVATGIANIWARDAVACNAAARTVGSLHPGRFLLGLGVSHQPLVQRLRGHDYTRPVAFLREYLAAMDAAPYLAYDADAPRPPRVLAALGPAALVVARDQADGTHPYLTTPEHTARAREVLGPDPIIAPEISVVVDPDLEEWRRRAHAHLEIYTGLPNYVNNWKRLGFTGEDAVRGGSDRLKEALVVRGVDAVRARVADHLDAGADHVCVQVLGQDPLVAPKEDWRTLAEALL